jgi:hypothetical protein
MKMSAHAEITCLLNDHLERFDGAVEVPPSALAFSVFKEIAADNTSDLVRFATIEHLKEMARRVLARRFTADGEDSVAHGEGLFKDTDDRFSGQLQPRYPLPRQGGQEPVYKLRVNLTADERAWNVKQLRKSARARLAHADALEAEGLVVHAHEVAA